MRLARSRVVARRSWSLLAALLLTGYTTAAQAQKRQELTAFGSVQLVTGGAYLNVDDLNRRYNKAGFNTISNDGIAFGLAGYGAWGSTLLGLEFGNVDYGEEGSASGRINRLESRHAMVQVGYAVLQKNWVQVYPFLGVGAGSVRAFARNAAASSVGPDTALARNTTPLFDQVVAGAGRDGLWLKGSFLLFEPGVGADFLLRRREGDKLGVVLGVRAGHRIAPNNTTWKWDGREVGAAPDTGPGGNYLRVSIGIGG